MIEVGLDRLLAKIGALIVENDVLREEITQLRAALNGHVEDTDLPVAHSDS